MLSVAEPIVMGILNVTPDSFSDGGRYTAASFAIERAQQMVSQGAQIIDVGGESTRPGARAVTSDEELERVIPIVEALKRNVDALISVDTSKVEVMKASISAGCHIINDVNGLRADGAVDLIASSSVAVVLMHMQGEPRTMQVAPAYSNVVLEVGHFLADRVQCCLSSGIGRDRIILDPGFGFGKTLEHNLELFNGLGVLSSLGFPLLIGVSRKSMIGAILDEPVEQRMLGSVVLSALSVRSGPTVLRVHDVAETVQAMKLFGALRRAKAAVNKD